MSEEFKIQLKHCLHFGLLISGSLILVSLLFHLKGWTVIANPKLTNVNYLLVISGIFIGIRKYRSDNGITLTYWQAFRMGVLIMTIAAIPFAIYSFLLLTRNPEMITHAIAFMDKSLKDASYTKEQTDTIINIYKTFATPSFMAFSEFINKILMGALFSLFLASILSRPKYLSIKHKNTNFDDSEDNNELKKD